MGRYELVGPLGDGGDAFHAVMHGPGGLRQPVALKLLRAVDPADRDALAQEARLGALLVHPNVVVAHDHGEHDGVPFVAMELVRGTRLRHVLARGPLPPAAVVEVGRQVCAGLSAIHALGATPLRTWGNAEDTWGNTWEDDGEGLAVPGGLVVHRDIKPETLLVDATGLVRIAGLGLARATRTAGRRGGTRGYMPPEQAHGLEDTRADLFALGATLAELALGERLLPDDDDDGALIEALTRLDLSRLDGVVSGLAAIVGRCLALDPDDRWPSAATLAEALEQLRPAPEPTLRGWVAAVVPAEHPRAEPVDGGNLPDVAEGFVGRAAELSDLARRLAEPGILTVAGPPGVGKSRLAIEAARSSEAGSAWLAELTPTRSLDGVCHAVARALDLALGGEPPVLQLAHALAARGDLLLVLDGIDPVPAAVSEALEVWRRRAPSARFLCTGRRPLGLLGERVLRLDPLLPGDAAALYQARAAEPDGVEALVDRLDRLPLAIEVAAAVGGRVAPAASGLRAALDAAWNVLGDPERAALTQLAVFDAGFTLHAAEAVLALPPGCGWALDRIDALVRARLVHRDPLHPDRYRMLALVRAWAGERLDPADRAAAEERHTRFFAQLGTPEALALSDARRLAPELDNLLVAWKRARRPARRAALALALGQLLRRLGPAARGEAILSEALAVPDLTSADTARLLRKRAQLLRLLGRTEPARASWAEALAISRSLPDPHHEAVSRLGLGHWFIGVQRTAEARPHLEAAMALVPTNPRLRAAALAGLSTCARAESRLEEARAHAEEVQLLAGRLSDPRLEARAQLLLGNVASHAGDVSAARGCYEAARHAWEELGDRDAMATALANLGSLARRQGRVDEARALYLGALAVLKALGSRRWQATILLSLATLEEAAEDLDAALDHCREALAIAEETEDRREPALIRGTLASLELEAGRPEAALRLLQQVLPELEVLDELATVGALQGVAGLAFAELGRLDEARRWLARGHRLLEAHGRPDLLCQHLRREARVEALAGDLEAARKLRARADELA